MDEALKAFSSPSWWVLSVVIGLLLNILAPFINKGIESFWASHSKRKADELARAEASIQRSVQYLLKKEETGLLLAKIEAMYWAVRIVLVLSIYLLLIQVAFSIPSQFANVAAAPIAVLGFLNITRFWKRWRANCHIHNLLVKQLKLEEED